MQDSQLHCSLRDGLSSVPSSSAGMISSGGEVPHGFALSAASESVSAVCEAWKGDILRDYSSARLDSFLESRGLARTTVFLFSLSSPGCRFLESSLFPVTLVASFFFLVPCFFGPVFPLFLFVAKVFRLRSPHSSRSLPSGGIFPSLSRQRVARSHSFPSREFFESDWIAGDCTWCSTCGR